MEDIEYFIIEGTKDLIFRKEEEEFIFFDPYDLEFYRLNDIASEIMYLISQEYNYDELSKHFMINYDISEDLFKSVLLEFLNNFPLLDVIYPNLIQLNLNL